MHSLFSVQCSTHWPTDQLSRHSHVLGFDQSRHNSTHLSIFRMICEFCIVEVNAHLTTRKLCSIQHIASFQTTNDCRNISLFLTRTKTNYILWVISYAEQSTLVDQSDLKRMLVSRKRINHFAFVHSINWNIDTQTHKHTSNATMNRPTHISFRKRLEHSKRLLSTSMNNKWAKRSR